MTETLFKLQHDGIVLGINLIHGGVNL